MKYILHDKYFCLVTKKNDIYSFYFMFPDRIGLGESYFGSEVQKDLIAEAKTLDPEYFKELVGQIDPQGVGIPCNFKPVSKLISEIYNVSLDEVNEYLRYDEEAVELAKELDAGWHYDECRNLLKQWNGDKERVKKYMKRFVLGFRYRAMVDIWPSEEDLARPTWQSESWLLHEFYNYWGKELNEYIRQAVEQYPDFNDIDLAAYVVDDLIRKSYEETRKRL